MERPFIFIECKTTYRNEFEVTEGRQPTYALFFLKEGSFRIKLQGSEHIVKEGDCLLLSDDLDFFRAVIDPISFVYLKFRTNPKCPFSVDIPLGIVKFNNKERFIDSIEKYQRISEAKNSAVIYYREHLLEDILLQAFAECDRSLSNAALIESIDDEIANCHNIIAKNAANYIRSNLDKKLSVADICRAVSTNPSTLNFQMRKEFSLSTAAYTEKVKMNSARSLLRNTTYSVGEIAERCGYDNIYYFSSLFKKYHDITPTEYRKNYKKEM